MDIDRFHNELAMRLGYKRIVKDTRLMIAVEESDEPWVTLMIHGYNDIIFKASDKAEVLDFETSPEMRDEIKIVRDAVYQAYVVANNSRF